VFERESRNTKNRPNGQKEETQMKQNDSNIIIDPSFAREQARYHHNRSIFWGVFSIVSFIVFFVLISSLQGCSDDDTDSKKDDKAAEIAQCKKMADSYESCLGWETMNTTLKAAKSECDKADFDKYDRCMFDCADLSIDCEVLTSCFDEC
jgi:hypothetical protein